MKMDANLPMGDYTAILSNASNKQELVRVLFECWEQHGLSWIRSDICLYLAGGFADRLKSISLAKDNVRSIPDLRSSQEEGDTRVLLHAMYAAQNGAQRVVTRANDTDIVVIYIFFFRQLATFGLSELFMQMNDQYFIPIHTLSQSFTETKSTMLPLLHALSGCDTTSYIYGQGKKTVLAKTTTNLEEEFASMCTQIQQDLSQRVVDRALGIAKTWLLSLYGKKGRNYSSNNQLRANMYCRTVDLRALPPTDDAYKQHVLRALLQTATWVRADKAKPTLPNLYEFGWKKEKDGASPILMTEPSAPKDIASSAYCSCKGKCVRGCPCRDIGTCALMCSCGGKPAACYLTANAISEEDI